MNDNVDVNASPRPAVEIFADSGALAVAAADRFVALAREAVTERGHFTVALAGGTTPLAMYDQLATRCRESVPWHAIDFFWGDERHVPPPHCDSNFGAVADAMLNRVPTAWARVYRIRGEWPDAEAAAADYEQVLRRRFALGPGQLPRFDLVLLGLGSDGHTASLFPDGTATDDDARLVVAPWVAHLRSHRISVSLRVLNAAAAVVFVVSGASKAKALRDVIQNEGQLPAQLVRPSRGRLVWMIDRPAAALLAEWDGRAALR